MSPLLCILLGWPSASMHVHTLALGKCCTLSLKLFGLFILTFLMISQCASLLCHVLILCPVLCRTFLFGAVACCVRHPLCPPQYPSSDAFTYALTHKLPCLAPAPTSKLIYLFLWHSLLCCDLGLGYEGD